MGSFPVPIGGHPGADYKPDHPTFVGIGNGASDRPGAANIVRFLPGRIRFGDSTTGPEPYSAPFSSALVVWRK